MKDILKILGSALLIGLILGGCFFFVVRTIKEKRSRVEPVSIQSRGIEFEKEQAEILERLERDYREIEIRFKKNIEEGEKEKEELYRLLVTLSPLETCRRLEAELRLSCIE